MKLLKPKKFFEIDHGGFCIAFKPSFSYICPESFVDLIRSHPYYGALVNEGDFVNLKEVTSSVDYTNRKLLITRTGGIGDFFFILRSVKEIKDKYFGVNVTFCCGDKYVSIVKTLFYHLIDNFLTIPPTIVDYDRCDYFFTFENFIELNPLAKKLNVFEFIAKNKFFIELTGGHNLEIKTYQKYNEQAGEIASTWTKLVIGIQPTATAVIRTYPIQYISIMVKMFNEMGYDVLFLEGKENVEPLLIHPSMKGVRVLLPFTKEIEGCFELSAVLAGKCKLIIAPDSVFTYVADSLGVPVIVLYSPFSSKLRADKLNVYAIDVPGACYNCCVHSYLPCKHSNDREGYSPCMKAIKPELVFGLAQKILKGEM